MPKILVIDDDPACVKIIAVALRRCGYDVLEASSAREGIRLVDKDRTIGLIITDVKMPDMSGLDMLEYFRLVEGVQTPVLICSRLADNRVKNRATELQASGYVAKPIDVRSLREQVATIVPKPKSGSKPTQTKLQFETPKGMDPIEATLKRLETTPAAYGELLGMLVDQLARGIPRLDQLVNHRLYDVAHSLIEDLKCSAANLGGQEVVAALSDIDQCFVDRDLSRYNFSKQRLLYGAGVLKHVGLQLAALAPQDQA